MWAESITLKNIKSFEDITIELGTKEPYKWITLLGENGSGKSTILQALGLLLASYEGALKLLPKPDGWVRTGEEKTGEISVQVHQGEKDEPIFGTKKKRKKFTLAYEITSDKPIKINDRFYTQPIILEKKERAATWVQQNVFNAKSKGWFAVGFGAFRRSTRENQRINPVMPIPDRYSNFETQFRENQELMAFEQWMVHLDFKSIKSNDEIAGNQKEIAIDTFNKILPEGTTFDSIDDSGRIFFNVKGIKVPTISLSDGYRSVLAFCGDLIWRLLTAFPDSKNPLKEEGIVLIDELDIHLHPIWQWKIAQQLRELFPNIQFIVATHSPLIAAGAGSDAITYRLKNSDGQLQAEKIEDLAFKNIQEVLNSDAFQLVSTHSYEVEQKHRRHEELKQKKSKTKEEEKELKQLEIFVEKIFAPTTQWEKQRNEYLKDAL